MALVIILIKAGLSLDLGDLKKVGRPALPMSCLPATVEIAAWVLLAPMLLPIGRMEAAVIGAILGAVSPAVVVPKMVQLMENRWGTGKGIPQLILAGASLDDVYVIVVFTTFLGMAQGGSASWSAFGRIPVSILTGIGVGALTGLFLSALFESCYRRRQMIRNSTKTIVILGTAFLLVSLEDWLESLIPFSGLLAVTAMACLIRLRSAPAVSQRLSQKFGKLWLAAEVTLFVLVGAAVDIRYTLQAGLDALAMIGLALLFRSVGVLLCLLGTSLSPKERLFCVIAYLPKATVQAAIGSVPLSLGLPWGNLACPQRYWPSW